MAALCTGTSYGLSQNTSNDNKEVYFVKFTDSAYRAIEDYQKNQNKLNSNASIQFLGTQGYLSFPTTNGCQKFSFSISETDGVQGSFSCMQQINNQLEVVGSLTNKIRIHANEDVYEATRHRMAVVEETQKNKCTREIKPNQTDIGRKVKVKPPANRLSNIPSNSTLNKRDSYATLNSLNNNNNHISATITQSSKNNINNTMQHQLPQHQHQASFTTSKPLQTSTVKSPSTIATTNSNVNNSQNTGLSMSSSVGGLVPRKVTNSRQNSNSRGNTELMKRPLRERLIHALALKAYKKPEIFHKIHSEGVREKERSNLYNILKSISIMRDNLYYLKRHIWNDVQDDWAFYSEQDKQCLKRRKPQNLTPPLSSDGGSGQSPCSTHNGSPPPAVKRPSMNSDKYSSDGGPTSKKQRISHYKKDVNHDSNRRNILDSRDSANLNPRSREFDNIPMRPSSHYGSSANASLEPEDNGSSLSFGVLNSEAANRISNPSASISDDQDSFEEHAQFLELHTSRVNGATYDFSEFSTVLNLDQRRQYKRNFEKDFVEYKLLFANRLGLACKFTEMNTRLRQVEVHTELYQAIRTEIVEEYRRAYSTVEKRDEEDRFQYLHQKLSLLKDLINKYDGLISTPKRSSEVVQENH